MLAPSTREPFGGLGPVPGLTISVRQPRASILAAAKELTAFREGAN